MSFDEHLINGIKLSFTVSVFVTPRNFYLLTGCTNFPCYFLDIVLVFNFQIYDLSQVGIFWCGVVVKVYYFPKGIGNCSVFICWKCFLFSAESSEVLCQNWLYVCGSVSGLFCFTDLFILINTAILEFQCLYGTACCSSLERGHFLFSGNTGGPPSRFLTVVQIPTECETSIMHDADVDFAGGMCFAVGWLQFMQRWKNSVSYISFHYNLGQRIMLKEICVKAWVSTHYRVAQNE